MGEIYKKIVIFGIAILFIAVSITPCIKGNNNVKNSSLTFYIVGTTIKKYESNLSLEDAQHIYKLFIELQNESIYHPLSKKTKILKQSFINLLYEKNLLQNQTKNDIISLLNPAWDIKNNFFSYSLSSGIGINFLGIIVSAGTGITFPIILFLRPHLITPWISKEGSITIVRDLFLNRGFIAVGRQIGIALGFTGIGMTLVGPKINLYGFFGYSIMTIVLAEETAQFPPNHEPIISNEDPPDGSINVPTTLSELRFKIEDPDGDFMSYKVTTEPDIGSGSGKFKKDGFYTVPVSNLKKSTTYKWHVSVSDGKNTVEKTFTFTTETPGLKIFYPTDDATITHRSPDSNSGSGSKIMIRNEYGSGGSTGWASDGLIKFDLSSLPSGTKISYAVLKLYYYKWYDNNPAGRTINLYRILNDWNENSVTWNNQPNYATLPTSYSIVPSSTGTWMEWNVTKDVQMFVNGETNYGWKITDENYWGKVNIPITYFKSKESDDHIPFIEIKIKE